MVAHAVRANTGARGVRSFDPTRDLAAVARLLEEAFRPEHTFPLSNAPVLREVGIVLWTMSYAPVFPENVSGFVWMEDGQLVGNVTISQDEGRLDRYMISNVAVKPNYRRQGIARALMQAAIEQLHNRAARWVLLNVRPNNTGAIRLYRDLGFEEIEMRGEWSAPPQVLGRQPAVEPVGRLVPMRPSDRRAAFELLHASTPASVQQFRPVQLGEFGPNWEDRLTERIADWIVGQATRRWVLELDGRVAALLMVRGQRLASPQRIAIRVHPDYNGKVESALVRFSLDYLRRFSRREIRAQGTSTHPQLVSALEQNGFHFSNGLTLMARSI